MSTSLPVKHLFELPEGVIYLDGNSLGPLPRSVPDRIAEVVNAQWGTQLIRAWNESQWMEQPARVGNKVARLVGASAGSVVMGDTLSIKVFQALAAALKLASPRESAQRGSQVSFAFEHGYATMQALIAEGVIGDFRAPDIMRFGFTPLYLDEQDVVAAVDILQNILDSRRWEDPIFQITQSVT